MEINNSVQCRAFFRAEIQNKDDGDWLIQLSPNGQILELIYFPMLQRDILQKALQIWERTRSQVLFVRLSQNVSLFNEEDWLWVGQGQLIARKHGIPIVDFIKISENGCTSLIKFIDLG